MKRRLWVLIVGLGILFPLCAQETAATLSEDIAFDQEQYAMLLRCSEKGDVTEWNEWVQQNTVTSKDMIIVPIQLQGADFRKANLKGVNLRFANLEGANFYGADLTGAIFQYGDLKGTNFSEAVLYRAHLGNASRDGANFFKADLREALLYQNVIDF